MKEPASTNEFGYTKKDYVGAPSTLCTGCGHDSVTSALVSALFQSGIHPFDIAKMSGIGCSSKTPAYFLNQSHGFNSIHGRMAPVSIGAGLTNRHLHLVGISGDGDTASIGLSGFAHLIRRNLPIVYIVENNGVYGLTKGQFSATSDPDSLQKSGESNPFSSIDLCSLAIELGCTFVARSFSGDAKQLVPLIDAALHHRGTAVIDVISPCVTFANHEGSTKSYNYVKEHKVALQELGFIAPRQEIRVDYEPGTYQEVRLHDESVLVLKKVDPREHRLDDSSGAITMLRAARERGEILTGLFFLDESKPSLAETLNLTETSLADLEESEMRPSPEALPEILKEFR